MIYSIINQILKIERGLNRYEPTVKRFDGSATELQQNISKPNLLFGRIYLQNLANISIIPGFNLFL